jgi:hypothetical protein
MGRHACRLPPHTATRPPAISRYEAEDLLTSTCLLGGCFARLGLLSSSQTGSYSPPPLLAPATGLRPLPWVGRDLVASGLLSTWPCVVCGTQASKAASDNRNRLIRSPESRSRSRYHVRLLRCRRPGPQRGKALSGVGGGSGNRKGFFGGLVARGPRLPLWAPLGPATRGMYCGCGGQGGGAGAPG